MQPLQAGGETRPLDRHDVRFDSFFVTYRMRARETPGLVILVLGTREDRLDGDEALFFVIA